MSLRYRYARKLGAILAVALPVTGFGPVALAQTDDGARAVEEIVVTARRREETLQSVPIAISAFNASELERLQADQLDGIQGAVPNLNLVQGRGSASSANVFIRGIGQPDALQTFDPAVGIYLDDVYISRIQGALFSLYDIERIEVLRGPQGTLYGKNTIAGAIRLVSRKPSQEFEARGELTVGDYSRTAGRFYLTGGLTDTLAVSFSGLMDQRDGLVDDPISGREYNDRDNASGRLALAWDPTENFEAILAVDATRQKNALTMGRLESDLVQTDLALGPVVLQPAPTGEYDFEASSVLPNDPGQDLTHWGTSLTLTWDLNDAYTAKSISAWRRLEADFYIDIDATPFEVGDVFVGIDQEQISQEFQLLYDAGGDFTGVAGLYYLHENIGSDQEAYADDFLAFGGLPLDFLRTIGDDLTLDSYALFAQGTYAVNEQLSATFGIRYTTEDKEYFRTTSTFSNLPALTFPPFVYTDDDSWDAVTPTLALDYEVNEQLMYYGSISRGFKSGGFNGRANSPGDTGAFDPEYVWTYEVGNKRTMADGRLQLNTAVFFSQYEDFQARVAEVVDPDAPVPSFTFPVLNAGELDIWGVEVEANWLVTDELNLAAQIGYLDADYKEFIDDSQPDNDRSDDEPPFAPDWTARLAATYTMDLGANGSLTLGADANYRGKAWLSVDNRDVLTQDDYWLFNALATWTSMDERWNVTAGIKNIGDEVYKTDAQEFSSVGNIQTAYYGDPRTWSLSLGFRY
ncbi:TonB-dependent receptor [Lentisalinibacter sediminis]|uniref:TonB-dependent receptor n=1 Tax=Lentisalinibacter sediminis TaxID=2992237 RepID=UPI00386B19B2